MKKWVNNNWFNILMSIMLLVIMILIVWQITGECPKGKDCYNSTLDYGYAIRTQEYEIENLTRERDMWRYMFGELDKVRLELEQELMKCKNR